MTPDASLGMKRLAGTPSLPWPTKRGPGQAWPRRGPLRRQGGRIVDVGSFGALCPDGAWSLLAAEGRHLGSQMHDGGFVQVVLHVLEEGRLAEVHVRPQAGISCRMEARKNCGSMRVMRTWVHGVAQGLLEHVVAPCSEPSGVWGTTNRCSSSTWSAMAVVHTAGRPASRQGLLGAGLDGLLHAQRMDEDEVVSRERSRRAGCRSNYLAPQVATAGGYKQGDRGAEGGFIRPLVLVATSFSASARRSRCGSRCPRACGGRWGPRR